MTKEVRTGKFLIARLREAATWGTWEPGDMAEAADEIERLRDALKEIAGPLGPGYCEESYCADRQDIAIAALELDDSPLEPESKP